MKMAKDDEDYNDDDEGSDNDNDSGNERMRAQLAVETIAKRDGEGTIFETRAMVRAQTIRMMTMTTIRMMGMRQR
jgi:hypothetical protein